MLASAFVSNRAAARHARRQAEFNKLMLLRLNAQRRGDVVCGVQHDKIIVEGRTRIPAVTNG